MYGTVQKILLVISIFPLRLSSGALFVSFLTEQQLEINIITTTIIMSYLLIKNNGRPKGPAPQRNGRRNPSIPLNRVGGSGPSWQRNGASSSSSSSSSLRRAGGVSSFAHNGGGGGPSNRGGMNGNAVNNGDAVVNSGGGQIQLQRPVVATQQQQQQQQQQKNQQQNQQQGDNLQQGIVSMDDGEYKILPIVEEGRGDKRIPAPLISNILSIVLSASLLIIDCIN